MTNWYVWHADLNSLYDEKPKAAVVYEKYNTKEEANTVAKSLQTHDVAAWVSHYNCEDENFKWDSENPCLSVSYKNW